MWYLDAIDRHCRPFARSNGLTPQPLAGKFHTSASGFISAGAGILLDARAHGTLIDDRFIRPGQVRSEGKQAVIDRFNAPKTKPRAGMGVEPPHRPNGIRRVWRGRQADPGAVSLRRYR
jgi:hypothetical protein